MIEPLIVVDPPTLADVRLPAPQQIHAPTSLVPPLIHLMTTYLRDDIVKKRDCIDGIVKYSLPRALLTVVDSIAHTCYTEASKQKVWHAALADEINDLLKNNTWILVPSS